MKPAATQRLKTCLSIAAIATLMPAAAAAVDGVILIDQNRALAGGVTPGDTAGFPVTISQAGSYRLSSNLIVPNSNTTAIELTAGNVTIDLNGFAIIGPTDCSGGLSPCAGEGTGLGIFGTGVLNVTITNGKIQGMGNIGIGFALSDGIHVRHLTVVSNGDSGIRIFNSPDLRGSIVEHSIAQRNGNSGISISRGIVSNSDASVNRAAGIDVETGAARYNVMTRNGVGLTMTRGAYIGNVLDGNVNGVSGSGINMGQNLCNNAPCPNAQF